MPDRALLVGINDYPAAPLRGCVNDVNDVAEFLVNRGRFKESAIRLLTDARATASAITERLQWLVKDATPGDRLLFHYSGHGVQLPTRDPNGELDGLDEAICPVDFDWTTQRALRDKDFIRLFRPVPKGVHFIWISDSCHSGDLSRRLPTPPSLLSARSDPLVQTLFTPIRWLGMPADLAWRLRAALAEHIPLATLAGATRELNVALITACRSDQTAADAFFKGRANGALTYMLLKTLSTKDGLSLPIARLMAKVRAALKKTRFSQEPQLEGARSLFTVPFLGIPEKS